MLLAQDIQEEPELAIAIVAQESVISAAAERSAEMASLASERKLVIHL
jgi:hypothetical protein